MILADGCELTIDGGIQVAHPNSLTIYGQSEGNGELTATALPTDYNAGIGGTVYSSTGNIVINGGTVTATGGEQGAGIGDGMADENMPVKVASIT